MIHAAAQSKIEKGSVAICFFEQALIGVREKHLDADALLQQAGISPRLLLSPQARVSSANYCTLWRVIAQTLDDKFFGQDFRRMKVGSFAMLCKTVIHCKTLGQALHQALLFFDSPARLWETSRSLRNFGQRPAFPYKPPFVSMKRKNVFNLELLTRSIEAQRLQPVCCGLSPKIPGEPLLTDCQSNFRVKSSALKCVYR